MFFSTFTRGQKMTTVVFAIANFCSATCISLQAPFYPKEAEKKGASPSQYGFVFGIYELFIFLSSPFLGRYMHKLGAWNVYIMGIFTTSTCCIVFGLLDEVPSATAFIWLSFIVRSLEAIGNSCILTSSFAIIAKEFPDRTSTMFAWLETSFGFGLIVGPTIGASLYEAGGYYLPFVVLGGFLLLTAILSCFFLPMNYNVGAAPGEVEKGWLDLVKIPLVALSSYSLVCSYISLGFLLTTLEPHLRSFDLSPIMIGVMFIIHGGSYAITAPVWGWLCDKVIQPFTVISIGAGLVTISFVFIGPLPFLHIPKSLPLIITCLVVHGTGFAAILVSSFGMSQREAVSYGFPEGITTYALISGLWTSASALGAFIGPSIAGILFDNFRFPWASLFAVISELTVLILTFGFVIVRIRKRKTRLRDYERIDNLSVNTSQLTTTSPGSNGYGSFKSDGNSNRSY